MYCSQCGTPLKPGSKFCSRCGAQRSLLDLAVPIRNAAGAASHPSSWPEQGLAPRPRHLPWILLGLVTTIVAACIGVVAGLSFLSRGSYEADATGAKTTQTIGPRGGELVAAGGFKLVFPEGALSKNLQVSVVQDPSPPPAPAALVSVGPAYKVSLPPDTILPVPVQLVLPFQRQPGLKDDCYGAYLWDGKEWLFAGGEIDGNVIRAEVFRFSEYQVKACSVSEERPVLFVNLSAQELNRRDPSVTPWDVILDNPTCGGGIRRLYTVVNRCGGHYGEFCGALQTYHWGTYNTWCFWWQEPDVETNWMVPYHLYLARRVVLNDSSCTLAGFISHRCEPERVSATLPPRGTGLRGMCGEDSGQPPVIAGQQPPQGANPTPTPTNTPASIQPTPTRTRTVGSFQPTLTPTRSAPRPIATVSPTATGRAPTVTRTTTLGPAVAASHTPVAGIPATVRLSASIIGEFQVTKADGTQGSAGNPWTPRWYAAGQISGNNFTGRIDAALTGGEATGTLNMTFSTNDLAKSTLDTFAVTASSAVSGSTWGMRGSALRLNSALSSSRSLIYVAQGTEVCQVVSFSYEGPHPSGKERLLRPVCDANSAVQIRVSLQASP